MGHSTPKKAAKSSTYRAVTCDRDPLKIGWEQIVSLGRLSGGLAHFIDMQTSQHRSMHPTSRVRKACGAAPLARHRSLISFTFFVTLVVLCAPRASLAQSDAELAKHYAYSEPEALKYTPQQKAWVVERTKLLTEVTRLSLLLNKKDLAAGISLLDKVIGRDQVVFGVQHPEVADRLIHLADLYSAMDESNRAIRAADEARQIREAVFGVDDSRTRQAKVEIARLRVLARLNFQDAEAARRAANRANEFRSKSNLGDYNALLKDASVLVVELQRYFGEDNWYEVGIQLALSDSASNVADFARALEHIDRAEKLTFGWFGPISWQALECLRCRAVIFKNRGEIAAAENAYEQALVLTRKIGGLHITKSLEILSGLSGCAIDRGQRQKAIVITEQVLKAVKSHPELGRTWLTRATYEHARAIGLFRKLEAIRLLEELVGDISQDKDTPKIQLADCYSLLGAYKSNEKQYPEAIRMLQKADEIYLQLYGAAHLWRLRNLRDLGSILEVSGDFPAALEIAKKVVAEGQAAYSTQNIVLRDAILIQLRCLDRIGRERLQQGDFDQASSAFMQRVELVRNHLPKDGYLMRKCEHLVEQVKFERGLSAEQRKELQRALALHEEGRQLALARKYAESLDKFLTFSEIVERLEAANRPEMIQRRIRVAEVYSVAGRLREAIAECEQVQRMLTAAYPDPLDPPERRELAMAQGFSYATQGNHAKAADSYRAALESIRRRTGIDNTEYLGIAVTVVDQLLSARRDREALAVAGEAIEVAKRVTGDRTTQYLSLVNLAGTAHFRLGQYQPAERSFNLAMAGFSHLGDARAAEADTARRNLAEVLEAMQRWSESLPLRKAALEYATSTKNMSLVARELIAMSRVHRALRQFDDAEGTAEEAVRLLEKAGTDPAPAQNALEQTWTEMREAAITYHKFREASEICQKQLDFRKTRYPDLERYWKEVEVVAREMERWAAFTPEQVEQVAAATAQLKEAEAIPFTPAKYELADKATDKLGELLGTDSLTYLNGLKSKAFLAWLHSGSAAAIGQYVERLSLIHKTLVGTLYECDGLCDLARVRVTNGEMEQAIKDYRGALAILDEWPKAFPLAARRAHIKCLMARAMRDSGRRNEGVQLLLTAHEELSRYRKDEPLWYLESLQLISAIKIDADSDVAIAHAHELRTESLRLRGPNSIGHCGNLNIAALILARHRQSVEAEECVRECLSICGALAVERSTAATDARTLLARILADRNQIADAVELTTQVLNEVKATSRNPLAPQLLALYAFLGELYLRAGNDAAVAELLKPVVAGAKQAGVSADAETIQSMHSALATSLLLSGRATESFDSMSLLLGQLDSQQLSDRRHQSEREQLTARLNTRTIVDRILWAGTLSLRTAETYQHVLRYKGGLMSRQRQLRKARHSPEVAPLFARWGEVSGQLAKHYLRQPTPVEQEAWDQRLAQLTLERDGLERKMCAQATSTEEIVATPDEISAALPPQAILLDILRFQALERNADRSIEQSLRYAVFISRAGEPVNQVNIDDAAEVDRLVNEWRSALQWQSQPAAMAAIQKGDEEALRGLYAEAMTIQAAAAAKLKSLIWEPLKPYLDGIDTVLVSADEELAKFPLFALPGDKPDTYLIEQYRFAGVPLPSGLPEMVKSRANRPKSVGKAVLIGDVNYDGPQPQSSANPDASSRNRAISSFYFSPLSGTGPEVAAIKAAYEHQFAAAGEDSGVTMLLRDEASEGNVLSAFHSHRWLHLATHGFFAEDVIRAAQQARLPLGVELSAGEAGSTSSAPPESLMAGLALAQANYVDDAGADDGILSAAEISTEPLDHVELTVLSACEAILGKSIPGEGMQGLERAFHVAGVRSTVTTLWPVSDQGARLLMSRFYRNLWEKKMSKVDALREAQLWCLTTARRTTDAEVPDVTTLDSNSDKLPRSFQDPKIWAPFVLGGDWE